MVKQTHWQITSHTRGCPLENGGRSSSPVLFLGREQCPTWDGCSCQSLAEGSSLCIPSFPPDSIHTSQGEIVTPQGHPSGSQVAIEDIVLHTKGGPRVPAGWEGLATISEPPSALGRDAQIQLSQSRYPFQYLGFVYWPIPSTDLILVFNKAVCFTVWKWLG